MDYTNLGDLFKGICDAIRAKKGTTGAIKHQDIPSEITSIKTQSQDVLSLASGITSYTESFNINGEERANVLVQPSDFSDETKVSWDTSTATTNYYTHSIESVEGSENGSAAVITATSVSNAAYSNVFWFDTTVNSSTAESRTYLIAIRAKASRNITSNPPAYMCYYHPTGNTSPNYTMSFSFNPTTEWKIFYTIVNIPSNRYMYDNTIAFYNHGDGTVYYIDWMAAYDVTGTNFANMTFGARATANSSDVLSGKSFYRDGVRYTGSMTDNGTVTPTLGRTTTSYTIPAGKHSGSGKVSLNIDSTYNSATPTSATLTYSPNGDAVFTSFTVNGDSDLVASNIKSGVSIFGVTGTYSGGNSTVGYISDYVEAERSSSQVIDFTIANGTNNIIGFFITASDTVECNSNYDYITCAFYDGDECRAQLLATDGDVYFERSTALTWEIFTDDSGIDTLEIVCNDKYTRFDSSMVYRCFIIYDRGAFDVSVN